MSPNTPETIVPQMNTRDVTQEFFSRFGSGDLPGVAALFAEPIDFHVDGSPTVPWMRKMPTTRDDIIDFYSTMAEHTSIERYSVDKIVVEGDDSVSLATFTLIANGHTIDSAYALHLTVHDGQITHFRMYEDSLAFAKAFDA